MLGMAAGASLTEELQLYASGHPEAANRVFRQAWPRLREIAAWKLSNPKFSGSATPSEVINETWATRLYHGRWSAENSKHFFALMGMAMEQVLADMARSRLAQRRGKGAVHLCLDDVSQDAQPRCADAEQVLAIQLAMEQLAKDDPVNAAIVRAHYIAGFSLEQIADDTGLTVRQVRHRWEKSKLWLASRMGFIREGKSRADLQITNKRRGE